MDFKENFKVLEDYTYLNTAATGLLPARVKNYRDQQNHLMFEKASLFRDEKSELLADVRESLADFFNYEPNKIALMPSFSFGFNALLEGLKTTEKVLLLEEDYPSINLAVEARDFETCYAKINANVEEEILKAVEEHQPTVFAFSIVQYVSGIKINFDVLQKLKNKFPDLLIVADGTQYLGTEGFDFKNSAIDVLGASAYKWLNAGFGNAFFMFKEHVSGRIYPKTIGFGSNIGKYKQTENAFIGKFEPGHLDTSNIGSIKVALAWQKEVGITTIEEKLKMLSEKAKTAFEKLDLLNENVQERKTHSTLFNIKCDEKLFQYLLNKKIICSQRGNGIRVSFHYYNELEDLYKLVEAIKNFKTA